MPRYNNGMNGHFRRMTVLLSIVIPLMVWAEYNMNITFKDGNKMQWKVTNELRVRSEGSILTISDSKEPAVNFSIEDVRRIDYSEFSQSGIPGVQQSDVPCVWISGKSLYCNGTGELRIASIAGVTVFTASCGDDRPAVIDVSRLAKGILIVSLNGIPLLKVVNQ